MRSYGEPTGRYDSQATMDVYTYINKDAKRGAAGAVPEMFWAYGRHPLDSAARLWYTGIQESAIRRGWPPSAGAFFPGSFHTYGGFR